MVVWFEDSARGRGALTRAYAIAQQQGAHLAVLTVATRERVIGCGRCLQGTVLWNIEMEKIAREELVTARRMLDGADDVSFEVVIGEPAQVLAEGAARSGAQTVVLPAQRAGRFGHPSRRNVSERLGRSGSWQVIVA